MRASGLACSAPAAMGSQMRPIARAVGNTITTLRQRHIVRAGSLKNQRTLVAHGMLKVAFNTESYPHLCHLKFYR